MFPLAAACRGDWRGIARAAAIAGLGAAVLLAAIFLSDAMYERFFGYDANMTVGGVTFNSSGRTKMWEMLWASSQESVVFGKGVGSSALLIDKHFPKLGHPHNDFLRFLHDFGVIGLACWLAFLANVLFFLRRQVMSRARANDRSLPVFLTPALALVALSASMFTDNSVTYSFVMAPLGVMLGCALGRMRTSDVRRPPPQRVATAPAAAPVRPYVRPRRARTSVRQSEIRNRQSKIQNPESAIA
jgi:O-antigen ligase